MNSKHPNASGIFANGIFDAHLSAEALALHVRDLAALPTKGNRRVAPLSEEMNALKRAYHFIAERAGAGQELEPAAVWILENFPFLEEALQKARRECRRLPRLPALAGGAIRAEAIAREAVAHTDALVDGETLALCAAGYLSLRGLRMAEIWALPQLLLRALAKAAAAAACIAAQYQRERVRADELADALFSGRPMRLSEIDLKSPAVLERLSARLREESGPLIEELDRQMLRHGVDRGKMIAGAHHNSSILQARISNAIRSIRELESLDWAPHFEALSPVEGLLRADKSGVYAAMDEASRSVLRRQVELLSSGHRVSQEQVARTARLLADTGEGREAEIGFYLYGPGTDALSARLGPKRPLYALQRAAYRHGAGLYMGACIALSAAVSLVILPWQGPLAAILALFPAAAFAARAVGSIVRRVFPPKRLLKLDFEGGLPESAATLVVIPCLLSSPEQARQQAKQLELLYLANRQSGIGFALLSDGKEHSIELREDDEEIIAAALSEINTLRQRHGPIFGLYHRNRVYHEGQQRYMGWERKRGALMQLNRYLLGGDASPFRQILRVEGDREFRFVLTLDADTVLPPGAVMRMAGALAHPLNRPGKDGYGKTVLAPRMESLPSDTYSRFQRLISQPSGLDVYAAAASEVYQDLCGGGIYCGKGIYDIQAFEQALDGKIPKNAVLSHDLLEGAFAGAALCSDIVFFDTQPRTPIAAMRRLHRWVRGDWQLIPFLFRKDLSAMDKWKMADNLRRSLTAAATLLCMLLGSPLFAAAAALLYTGVPKNSRQALNTLYQICILPFEAVTQLDAAARALYRTLISHRHMLDWVTAADTERRGQKNPYREMFAQVLFGVLTLISPSPLLSLLWLPGAAIAKALERPAFKKQVLPGGDTEFLRDIARRTFAYFEGIGPADHYLPPDNVQYEPYKGPARRTSPTNIGLALCAYTAAWDMGFLSAKEMLSRIDSTLSSVEALEKWNGHLYNWYATDTLRPLRPLYVSSVDSGNLAACLWASAAAARECGDPQGEKTAQRCEALVREMDFSQLYDAQRRLFYIGYDAQSGQMGGAHYDLLASESRLMSYIAICKGDVPPRHFAAIGRPVTRVVGKPCLLSWSGTMFEYLMPSLFLKDEPGTLLHQSAKGAVMAQRQAAVDRPFGESESGYYAFDLSLNYQYRAFGIPHLSMKGGLAAEQVIAPYASVLALMQEPKAAIENLSRLANMGALGPTGFIEAVDYTPDRVSGAKEGYRLVRSAMAHHQGMSLLALEQALGGRFLRRFMAIPAVRAYAPLLTEPSPRKCTPARLRPIRAPRRAVPPERPVARGAAQGEVHLLCAGESSLMLDHLANAIWRQQGTAITRFRAGQQEPYGPILYLRDLATGNTARINQNVRFEGGQALCFARLGGAEARLCIALSPEEGVLVQSLELTNVSGAEKSIEITAYLEPVLATQQADVAHRAFCDLFLEAEGIESGLLYRRRPRSKEQSAPLLAFSCSGDGEFVGSETSRMRFIGREGSLHSPAGLTQPFSMAGESLKNAPIEPCAALRRRVDLSPGANARVVFCAAAGQDDRQEILSRLSSCQSADGAHHALTMAAMRAQVELGYLKLDAKTLRTYERAAYALLHPTERTDAQKEAAGRNRLPQSMLWRFGLSGDLPIVLLTLSKPSHIPLARQIISAHEYWRRRGLIADLVLINDHGNDYLQPVQDKINDLIRAGHLRNQTETPGGVYRLDGQQITPAERELLLCRASLLLIGGEGEFSKQLPSPLPEKEAALSTMKPPAALPPIPLAHKGKYGGFSQDGSEYIVTATPPVPWSNIIANRHFGTLITQSMGGYTWHENSREHKLTPMCNDAVTDGQGEGIDLIDCATGARVPLALRCRHGQGYSIFEGGLTYLSTLCRVFVDAERPVKCTSVTLRNTSTMQRSLRIDAYARWILAPDGETRHLNLSVKREDDTLYARNGYNSPGRIAFLRMEGAITTDDETLSRTITLSPGESMTIHILLGCDRDEESAAALIRGFDPDKAYTHTITYWNTLLNRVQVRTSDDGLDMLLNRWLPYQALSSRFLGRTGFYQAGGAWGFRDQLQDALMLSHYDPSLLREQILRCAAHQFEEGDVQHWWHEPAKGVRTRIRDDLLFLPWAVAQYIERTGDSAILEERVPFLTAPLLSEGQEDAYLHPETGRNATLREHCAAALRNGYTLGRHGLPLMGGGDWNDAMNRVGIGGEGESVWLGWFLCDTLARYADVCDSDERDALLAARQELLQSIEAHGWDGEWYRRAFYDNGTPIGSKDADTCKIDLIAQAWAALAGGNQDRAKEAMDSAFAFLCDEDAGILRLLTPPFDRAVDGDDDAQDPGYIAGYLPGVRENGGQYTHGAAWAVLADCALGNYERARRSLSLLLPHEKDTDIYRAEPYVAAADVYGGEHAGRGGWTWYTGSAAWLWRAAVEGLCGLTVRNGRAWLAPAYPGWPLSIRYHGQMLSPFEANVPAEQNSAK